MFSIQKLFAKDDRFFELLEASAEESRASVQALKQMLKGGKALDEFAAARRKEKQITAQINELLARTSVTVLDREDIEAISSVLYKIPKTVEKFAERYMLGAAELKDVDFAQHVTLLERATDTVAEMVKELQKANFEKLIEYNERLQ